MNKPNTKLYVILLAISGALVALSFFLLIHFICNTQAVAVISCVISILGGALASISVSWLIDISNCKKRNFELHARKTENLKYIEMFLNSFFESIATSCNGIAEEKDESWEYWLRTLNDNSFLRSSADFYSRMLGVYVDLNCLIDQIDEANSGELKEFYLAEHNDLFSSLQLLLDSLKRLREMIFFKNDENIDHIIFCIKDVLSSVICLYGLNNKKYSNYRKEQKNNS